MGSYTTDELMKILNNINTADKLREYADGGTASPAYGSFAEYMAYYIKKTGTSPGELIMKSNIPRTYGYQLLDGRKNPGRDKVIALCLTLCMDTADVQRALTLAGHSVLYPRKRRDSILIFSINKQLSVTETNELLYEMDKDMLS